MVENGILMGTVSIGDLAVERDRKSTLCDISAATRTAEPMWENPSIQNLQIFGFVGMFFAVT